MIGIKKTISLILSLSVFANAALAQTAAPSLREYQARTNADIARISKVVGKDASYMFRTNGTDGHTVLAGLIAAAVVSGGYSAETFARQRILNETLLQITEKIKTGTLRGSSNVFLVQRAYVSTQQLLSAPGMAEEIEFLLLKNTSKEANLLPPLFKMNIDLIEELSIKNPLVDKEFKKLLVNGQRAQIFNDRLSAILEYPKFRDSPGMILEARSRPASQITFSIEKYELNRNISALHKLGDKYHPITAKLEALNKQIDGYFDFNTGEMSREYYVIKQDVYKELKAFYDPQLIRTRFRINVEETIAGHPKTKPIFAPSEKKLSSLIKRLHRLDKQPVSIAYKETRAKQIMKILGMTEADKAYFPHSLKRFGLLSLVIVAGAALANASEGSNSKFYNNIALLDHADAQDLKDVEQDPVLSEVYKTRADIINTVASVPEDEIKALSQMADAYRAKESRTLNFDQLKNKNTPNLKKYGLGAN